MADMENAETTPAQRAQLAKAWDTIENRKRILKGRGTPKPEEPKAPKKAVVRDTFQE